MADPASQGECAHRSRRLETHRREDGAIKARQFDPHKISGSVSIR
jgi:hypothetical protein